jgi:hypothetical protein
MLLRKGRQGKTLEPPMILARPSALATLSPMYSTPTALVPLQNTIIRDICITNLYVLKDDANDSLPVQNCQVLVVILGVDVVMRDVGTSTGFSIDVP